MVRNSYPFGMWPLTKPPYKICVLGLDGAGKSSLILRLKGDTSEPTKFKNWGFSQSKITISLPQEKSCLCIPYVCKISRKLVLYELGGHAKFRSIWEHYYAEVFGSIFVIDSMDRARYGEMREILRKIVLDPRMVGKPLLILCNGASAGDLGEIAKNLNIIGLLCDGPTVLRSNLICLKDGDCSQVSDHLKSGVEWLVKAVDLNYPRLRQKVHADMESQKQGFKKAPSNVGKIYPELQSMEDLDLSEFKIMNSKKV